MEHGIRQDEAPSRQLRRGASDPARSSSGGGLPMMEHGISIGQDDAPSRRSSAKLHLGPSHRGRARSSSSFLGFAVRDPGCCSVSHPVDDDTGLDAASYGTHPSEVRSFSQIASDMKKQTMVAPQELEHIQKTNPGLAAWLQSGSGFLMQVMLFAVFVSIDVGKSLFASKALKGTSVIPTSIVMSSSGASIIVGSVFAAACDGTNGVRNCFKWRAIKLYGMIAVIFAIAQCFQTLSYTTLSAGTIKTFAQLRLPQTAFLSWLIIGKRYMAAQCSVLAIIVLGALIFAQAGIDADEASNLRNIADRYVTNRTLCHNALESMLPNGTIAAVPSFCSEHILEDSTSAQEERMLLGLLFVFISCFNSDLGSVFSERFLQDDAATPFYVQKVAQECSGLPTAIVMSVFMPYFELWIGGGNAKFASRARSSMWWTGDHRETTGDMSSNWMFQGWGSGAFLALTFNCLGSWLSGLMVKKMSALMKLLGKVVSLAVVYFLGDCFFLRIPGRDIPVNKTLAQFVVMAATFAFLNIKAPSAEKKDNNEAAPGVPIGGELPSVTERPVAA